MTTRPGRLAPLFVCLASAAVQLPIFHRSVVSLDEGQLTAIAARLLGGDVLYRDVYTGIFPGIYWFAELLFAIFGVDVLVLRVVQLLVNAAISTSLYCLVRPLAPGPTALLAPLGYLALLSVSFPVYTMLTYSSLALLSGLVAVLAALRLVRTGSAAWGVGLGLALAACVLFKQNYGALVLAALGASGLWLRREGALRDRSIVRVLVVPVATGLAVAAGCASALVLHGAWPAFVDATFFTIFRSQMEAFNQPIPPILGPHPTGDGRFLFFYGPGALFGALFHGRSWASPVLLSRAARAGYGSAMLALALLPLVAWRFGVRGDDEQRWSARLVVPFAGLLFLGIFPSAIWSHLAAVYPPLLMVLVAALAAVANAVPAGLRRAVLAAGAFALVPAVAVAVLAAADIQQTNSEPSALASATLRLDPPQAELYRAADAFLGRCAPSGGPVFVAPDMPLLYASAGRRNPTPYDLVIPGDVRDDVLVDRITGANVKCVVFNPAMYAQFSSFAEIFPKLDALLKSAYRQTGSVSAMGTTWLFLEAREGRT